MRLAVPWDNRFTAFVFALFSSVMRSRPHAHAPPVIWSSPKQVIDEARTSGTTVHFASLMDICHLKNAELEAKHQKYKGRVVLRGDIVEDDSGSYAVFTEQGSSASQMTAAKIMDIISRLPGCDGQAADAVSAYTQVKMEDAHKLLKIPKSAVSRHLDSSTTTQVAKIMVQYGRPSRSS